MNILKPNIGTFRGNDKSKKLDYKINTDKNVFFKQYIVGMANKTNVSIPEGMNIQISSIDFDKDIRNKLREIENKRFWSTTKDDIETLCKKKGYSQEDINKIKQLYLFTDVRVNIYGSRIADMFELLAKDKEEVANLVDKMKISDKDKEKIKELKTFFDDYYKIEAEYNGKKYNLLVLSNEDKKELSKISPEFVKFIEEEQPTLKQKTIEFAQKEMKAEELSEAGYGSRYAAAALSSVLLLSVGKGVYDAKEVKEGFKKSEKFMNYFKENPAEGNKILNECLETLEKLGEEEGFEKIAEKMKKLGMEGGEHFVKQKAIFKGGLPKFVNPVTAFKNAKGAALVALLGTTLLGSADDCMGAVKDFVQDQNNFGAKTALGIGTLAVLGGVASSAAIAPTVEGVIDYKRAEKFLVKNGIEKEAKDIGSKLTKYGKLGVVGALLGMVIASSSSGSSWVSMALTHNKMRRNGDELEKKNIISRKENDLKNTNKNMMEYEAYKGKWSGITEGDWSIGALGGATGLFTHTNPFIQSLSFGLQGCSETLTACAYQLLGNKVRDNQIEQDKQAFLRTSA